MINERVDRPTTKDGRIGHLAGNNILDLERSNKLETCGRDAGYLYTSGCS